MFGHIPLVHRKQNYVATNLSYGRYTVYYIALYLFVCVVVLAGTAVVVVLPIIALQTEEVTAGPGSVYIPGTSFQHCTYDR
jgi:hypothetical protein